MISMIDCSDLTKRGNDELAAQCVVRYTIFDICGANCGMDSSGAICTTHPMHDYELT